MSTAGQAGPEHFTAWCAPQGLLCTNKMPSATPSPSIFMLQLFLFCFVGSFSALPEGTHLQWDRGYGLLNALGTYGKEQPAEKHKPGQNGHTPLAKLNPTSHFPVSNKSSFEQCTLQISLFHYSSSHLPASILAPHINSLLPSKIPQSISVRWNPRE